MDNIAVEDRSRIGRCCSRTLQQMQHMHSTHLRKRCTGSRILDMGQEIQQSRCVKIQPSIQAQQGQQPGEHGCTASGRQFATSEQHDVMVVSKASSPVSFADLLRGFQHHVLKPSCRALREGRQAGSPPNRFLKFVNLDGRVSDPTFWEAVNTTTSKSSATRSRKGAR